MRTAIFNVDNQQGPIVYSTGNSAQCYTTAWMEGEFGGDCVYVCVCVCVCVCVSYSVMSDSL